MSSTEKSDMSSTEVQNGVSVVDSQPPAYGSLQDGNKASATINAPVIAVTPSVNVGPEPVNIVCPSCRENIQTQVKAKATTKTHLIALFLCCFLCWPCAWVPYCMDSCQNADHYCPHCQAYIGTYSK